MNYEIMGRPSLLGLQSPSTIWERRSRIRNQLIEIGGKKTAQNGYDLTLVGIPESDREEVIEALFSSFRYRRREEIRKLKLSDFARLSPEQHLLTQEVERESREFYRAKLKSYGLSGDSMGELPGILYTRPDYKETESGNYNVATNIVQVMSDPRDFTQTLITIPHEHSHASVKVEIEASRKDDGGLKFAGAAGLRFIDNGILKGKGLEESMAVYDHVTFFYSVLATMYPEDYKRRSEQLNKVYPKGEVFEVIKKQYLNAYEPLYGSLGKEDILPFFVLSSLHPQIPYMRDSIAPQLAAIMLKQYLFGKKLSELIGRFATGSFDSGMGTEIAIDRGHTRLDKDRYVRTGDAQRIIQRVLGDDNAQKIFDLQPHDTGNIDDAMRTLVTVQNQFGH